MTDLVLLNLTKMTAQRISGGRIGEAFNVDLSTPMKQLREEIENLRAQGDVAEEKPEPSHMAFDAMATTLTA